MIDPSGCPDRSPDADYGTAVPGHGPDFAAESWVQVRYPLTREQEHGDRSAWPWLPGWVVTRCGRDEWQICVQTPELALEEDGEMMFPLCFRDSSELRTPEPEADWEAGQ
jgi:hypothetical protein